MSPGRRQVIIWTNAGLLIIRNLGNYNEMLIEIDTFRFEKIHLKISSPKWWQFYVDRNVLTNWCWKNKGTSSYSDQFLNSFLSIDIVAMRFELHWRFSGVPLNWKKTAVVEVMSLDVEHRIISSVSASHFYWLIIMITCILLYLYGSEKSPFNDKNCL